MKVVRYEATTTIDKITWMCVCGKQNESVPDELNKIQCPKCTRTYQLILETKNLLSYKEVDKDADLHGKAGT